jgi:chaperone modulatory protein CbpM
MSQPGPGWPEDEVRLDIEALGRSLRCEAELIVALVHEGVLEPQGASPAEWRFGAAALLRARRAVRLARDLDINPPGVALALQLLDEIRRLEAVLQGAVDRGGSAGR